ncbi:MAG: ester cyclase [Thermomicrobiales bacterium]
MSMLARWYRDFPYIHTLRFRLVMLVLAASLPALGLLYYTASQQRDDALDAGQQEATNLANLAAGDQERLVDQMRRYLLTLARLPELRGDNVYDCMALVKALRDDNASTYQNIGIIMADGTIPCQATGVRPAFFQDTPANLQAALAAKDMTISDIAVFPGSPSGTITYVYPVPDYGGTVDRLVFVSLPFSALQSFAEQSNPPSGTVFRMYNGKSTLLAQYPGDAEAAIPPYIASTPVPGVEIPVEDQTGTLLTVTGKPFLYASSPIEMPEAVRNFGPAAISVAVPRAEIVSRADNLFQENVGRLLIVAAVSIIAAWIGADLFTSGDAESRRRVVHQLYEAFSAGQIEGLEDLVSPRYVDHSRNPGQADGIDGLRQVIVAFKTAFPDGSIHVRQMVADQDTIVARVTMVGTHLGEFFGTPPSGRLVATEGGETYRFDGSLIVESWSLFGPLVPVHEERPQRAAGQQEAEQKPPRWRRIVPWGRGRQRGSRGAKHDDGASVGVKEGH